MNDRKAIWKYTLRPSGHPIEIPKDARILSVNSQANEICLWALVDPNAPKEQRRFVPIPTGKTMDGTNMTFIGTVLLEGGRLVFHIFEDCGFAQ